MQSCCWWLLPFCCWRWCCFCNWRISLCSFISGLYYRYSILIYWIRLEMPCAYNVFVFSLTDAYVSYICTRSTQTLAFTFALNKGCLYDFIGRMNVSVNELPMKRMHTHTHKNTDRSALGLNWALMHKNCERSDVKTRTRLLVARKLIQRVKGMEKLFNGVTGGGAGCVVNDRVSRIHSTSIFINCRTQWVFFLSADNDQTIPFCRN